MAPARKLLPILAVSLFMSAYALPVARAADPRDSYIQDQQADFSPGAWFPACEAKLVLMAARGQSHARLKFAPIELKVPPKDYYRTVSPSITPHTELSAPNRVATEAGSLFIKALIGPGRVAHLAHAKIKLDQAFEAWRAGTLKNSWITISLGGVELTGNESLEETLMGRPNLQVDFPVSAHGLVHFSLPPSQDADDTLVTARIEAAVSRLGLKLSAAARITRLGEDDWHRDVSIIWNHLAAALGAETMTVESIQKTADKIEGLKLNPESENGDVSFEGFVKTPSGGLLSVFFQGGGLRNLTLEHTASFANFRVSAVNDDRFPAASQAEVDVIFDTLREAVE